MSYLEDALIRTLNAHVYDVAVETPLELASNLSTRIKNEVWLKREDMQPVFSFKIRGAYNKMANLDRVALDRGVICASAGNHAQGVAMSAQRLGCSATIVMPTITPDIKVQAVAARGARVVLAGDSFNDAYNRALQIAAEENMTFVHPYDDPDVMAGQGTVAMEILHKKSQHLDAIFCAVGGGGLIAGIAAYVKRLRPTIQIIGVEAEGADAMTQSLQKKERVMLDSVQLFADGAAVKQVGALPFEVATQCVDDMIVVSNDEICAAIQDVFEDTRSILEPAGALSVAGLKAYTKRKGWQNKGLVAVTSGANMNFDRLRFVAERAEIGNSKEALLAVTIPETPGSFYAFLTTLGHRNITEFNYRYGDPKRAQVFAGVTIRKQQEVQEILDACHDKGLEAIDLSHDEMAKMHLRYMVGGRAGDIAHERIFRFVFPEHPGALTRFLNNLQSRWNISLFHYRNHGSDYGRVLVGMQIPASDDAAFQDFVVGLGYPYQEETDNPAYARFLR